MRRRLTDEEREIRRSAGISFARWWPALALLVVYSFASTRLDLLERCVGDPLDERGKAAALLRTIVAVPCSPFLLSGPVTDWLLFAAMWVPVYFAVQNWRWAKRHQAYWHGVRRREKERKVERHAQKSALRDKTDEQS